MILEDLFVLSNTALTQWHRVYCMQGIQQLLRHMDRWHSVYFMQLGTRGANKGANKEFLCIMIHRTTPSSCLLEAATNSVFF